MNVRLITCSPKPHGGQVQVCEAVVKDRENILLDSTPIEGFLRHTEVLFPNVCYSMI